MSVGLPRLQRVLTMTAAIQEIPPDHRGGYELERDDISASEETYDTALGKIEAQLRPGWRILSISVVRS